MFSAFKKFGKLGALASSVARAWSPLALWPNGASSPGMWIDPSLLTASFNDYAGTTPVATPGSVADSANPVGLALDIRAGAPETLGPELVVNGDFSAGTTGWTGQNGGTCAVVGGELQVTAGADFYGGVYQTVTLVVGRMYLLTATVRCGTAPRAEVRVDYACSPYTGNTTDTILQVYFVAPYASNNIQLNPSLAAAGDTVFYSSISVREIPGNHMLQSTSAARPLESARVNLLTYTEDFSNSVWSTRSANVTRGANLLTPTTDTGSHYVGRIDISAVAGVEYSFKVKAKANGYNYIGLLFYDLTTAKQTSKTFNVSTGAVAAQVEPDDGITSTAAITGPDVDGYYDCSILTAAVPGGTAIFDIRLYNNTPSNNYAGDGTSAVNATDIQVSFGTQAYQAILTDGSTYSATGITPFQLYDGIDDGMATASFSAGTLVNGMDCMIAVRRDSLTFGVAGIYCLPAVNANIGLFDQADSSTASYQNCGTPTVWLDGVQIASNRAALYTALTAGDWHILEYRGIDASAWVQVQYNALANYIFFAGGRGDILLFPSTASTEDKDAARQYLADKYGVTLA